MLPSPKKVPNPENVAMRSLTVEQGPLAEEAKVTVGLLFKNEEGAGFVVYVGMRIDDQGYHANTD